MKIPFTALNLWHQKRRTAIAIAGVSFANILVFMQLGFLGAAESTATMLVDQLDCDLVLASPNYLDINRPGDFPRDRLYQVLACPEVLRVVPLYVGTNAWRIVAPGDNELNGRRRSIQVVAFDVRDQPLLLPEVRAQTSRLMQSGAVLIDRTSRNFFGDLSTGVQSELGVVHVEVVGHFTLGTGFGADGLLLASDRTFSRAFGDVPLDHISLGLITLRPGADVDAAAEQVRRELTGGSPGGNETVRVLTRQALGQHESDFWVSQTSVGKIFTMGVVVGLLVGGIFVYQVISSDIKARITEFATLKAIGYGNGYLNRVVLEQALWYGVLSFVPALLASLALYAGLARLAQIPITMTLSRAGFVLLLTLGMCMASGMLALRRVKSLDPADLF
jgi:putative ABC transport system permease protein